MTLLEVDIPQERSQLAYDPLTTPYEVDRVPFPSTGSRNDRLRHLVRYAILAPSSHNAQPWKFRLTENGIAVYADYSRRLPVSDPDNRELLMSIGAAIMNLRIAAQHFGFDVRVEYNLSDDSELPVAFVHLDAEGAGKPTDPTLEKLFPMITKRHTNRKPFLLARVPEAVLGRLADAVQSDGVRLYLSTDPNKNAQVAHLVAEAERILQANQEYRKELSEWMRPNATQRTDGMTGATFGVGDLPSMVMPWAVKTLDLGGFQARRDERLCMEAPALGVLYSDDSISSWLAVGETLERMLLTIIREGLQYSFFNMPIELPDVRLQLRRLLNLEMWPQLLLRIGYSLEQPAASPRRPVEECIISEA